MYWMFGITYFYTHAAAIKLLNNFDPKFDLWRNLIGYSFEDYLSIISVNHKNRNERILQFYDMNIPVIALGVLEDFEDPEVVELFELTNTALLAEPREVDFHIHQMALDDPVTWGEASENLKNIKEQVALNFENIIILK